MKKDEYVRVLDFLPEGKAEVPPHKRKPIAQVIGEKYFSLLEIVPRKGVKLEPRQRVYIGEGLRKEVDHIERRIKYDWLTPTAKAELESVLAEIVKENEKQYVDFFNKAGIITTRLHKLEVLPKIGKKHRQEIIEEREKKPFESFEDIKSRIKNMPDPVKVIVEKIIEELKGESKYYFFVPLVQPDRKRQHR
ncbi:MAG TPA: DUF655 domain-containing protein [Candidatus Altiarchaeales archaeon]|nr:MAG: DUF655 domain-containing protein [Candidatus Altiarchaeales archaeon]HDN83805.1 DUF655 domain-containing protein [Candidatus Altiarchaeales archaeon]